MEKLAVTRMEKNDIGIMLAAKLEHMIEETPFRDLADRGYDCDGFGTDLSIDGDGMAACADGALEEDAGDVDPVIDRAIEDGGIDARGQIVTAALGPFAVPVNGGRLVQCKIADVQMRMIGGVDSIFCASTGVPGDILTDDESEIVLVAGRVNALVAQHESEGRREVILHLAGRAGVDWVDWVELGSAFRAS